ncbi:hypothetical protein HK100_012011, partial [Physocladia obscura]
VSRGTSDTCVDSQRKARQTGVTRGPYRRRGVDVGDKQNAAPDLNNSNLLVADQKSSMLGNLVRFANVSETKVPVSPIRYKQQEQQLRIPPFLRLILTDPADQKYPPPHMSPISLPSTSIKLRQEQQIPEFSSADALAMLSEVAILAEYTQKITAQRATNRLALVSPKKFSGYSPYPLPQLNCASPCNYSAVEYPQNQSQMHLLRSPSFASSNEESAEFSDTPATPDLMLQGPISPVRMLP